MTRSAGIHNVKMMVTVECFIAKTDRMQRERPIRGVEKTFLSENVYKTFNVAIKGSREYLKV